MQGAPKTPLLRLHFNGFIFTPYLFSTLMMLLGLTIFILLGIWQLHRAAEKESILQQYQQQRHAKPVNYADIKNELYQYYPVQIQGHFDNAHNFLLDNRSYQHQFGYQVLTPFLIAHSSQWLLVNRGWIKSNLDRKNLPNIAPIYGEQILTGLVYFPSKKTFVFKQVMENTKWPRIIEKIDLTQLQQQLNYTFASWTMLLSTHFADNLVRDWHPTIISPKINIGYALQWFTFGLVLIIIFIALNTKRVNT